MNHHLWVPLELLADSRLATKALDIQQSVELQSSSHNKIASALKESQLVDDWEPRQAQWTEAARRILHGLARELKCKSMLPSFYDPETGQ